MACFHFKINKSGNLWLLINGWYHFQVRMNEAEVLCFHAKLWDEARKGDAYTEHHGNVIVFVWAYKIKCILFREYFCPSLPAKSQKS